ncbi:glycine cleavage system protein R [Salsipaludibacter albus]|uniref:glycine cleavage system protein R n=1 Tax=Salsipaludibacter albus TaxID=2849650 RepID=UPI001EE44B28|nr:ACT domain-containing protein [Salsipaludibacter albus]MBY5163936.1 amino acid-binding ACT protein [Salsipaludibacter albus]
MASYVLSLIGTDRTGLVAAVADVVTDHGGNWEQSHLGELAGVFAGVVLVTVPDGNAAAFRTALGPLRELGLLDTSLHEGEESVTTTGPELAFELVGNDRPGIVHDVSRLLSSLDVSIAELRTETSSAPMAGGNLFHAAAVVRLPDGLEVDTLVERLEGLADEIMVDLTPAAT